MAQKTLFNPLEVLEERLWSIIGYFTQPRLRGGVAPFGGYFFQDLHLGGTITHGELVDALGQSEIKGKIIPDVELSFEKKYCGENDIVLYEFKKEGDIYVGRYKRIGRYPVEGPSQCIITPITKL